MLRTIVHKKNAVIFVILVCLAAALATIWPMRLYRESHAFSSGLDPVMASDPVDADTDAGEYFYAQYDHLQTLEFYVDSVIAPGQADVQLFHVGDNNAMELVAEEVIDLPDETPGFAIASIDADMTVGDLYVYTVHAAKDTDPGWDIVTGAEFTVFFESAADAEATGNAPLYQLGFYNDSGIEGVALKTRLNYRVALSKGPSALLGAVFAGAAAVCIAFVCLYYRKRPGKNTLITVLRVMQSVLTPVVLVVFGLAFVAVWPLRMFDSRVLDILIYEAGIILGAYVCLYGLWHDRSGEPDLINTELFRQNGWHYGIIICIALIMNFSADYMNAVNDHLHDAAMHRIVAMMCLIVLLMGDAASNFNAKTAVVTVISLILGVLYTNRNSIPSSMADTMVTQNPWLDPAEEIAQENAVIRTRAFACGMAAIAVTSVICMLVDRIRRKKRPETTVRKWIVIPMAVFAVMMLIFRNTRLWIPLLVGIWLLFYVRWQFWGSRDRGRFLQDLCEGILLDFICKVIYSMLHRYYMAYLYSRFSMHFHTPTVTAYYLCVVAAAALTLFLKKWRESGERVQKEDPAEEKMDSAGVVEGKRSFRQRLPHIWKEAILLGFVESYMVMSLSRAGIAVMGLLAVIGSFCIGTAPFHAFGQWLRKSLAAFGMTILLLIIVFPMAFTGQRIVSTVYAHPRRFKELEPYDDRLLRNVDWNSTRFMNIEIFIRDFGDRIIGGDIGSKIYYDNDWYIRQGYKTSMLPEESQTEVQTGYVNLGLVASRGNVIEELGTLAGASADESGTYEIGQESSENTLQSEDHSNNGEDDDPTDGVSSAGEEETAAEDSESLEYGSIDTGDVSNGRLWLYHLYLQNLNMTGHDVMGVDFGNGEMAMHAHNILLQTAYDCGIPTGIVFAVLLVLLFIAVCRYAGKGSFAGYTLEPLLLIIGFILVGMVEWIFHFSNPYTIAVLFSLAPVLFPEREGRKEQPDG